MSRLEANPYAPPKVASELPDSRPSVLVDGRFLVVGRIAALPSRCVITNASASSADRRTRHFDWAPSFRLVLRRRRCRLSYCISSKPRNVNYVLKTAIGTVAFAVAFLFVGYYAVLLSPVIAVYVAALPADRLRVVNERDGRFWIAGCGEEFLQSCKQEFGTYG